MICRRNVITFIATVALTIGATAAFAHNGIEHVMGTVKSVTDSSITVDTVKHTSITVMVDASTTYTNKEARATLKDLKTGERVVIDAKDGTDKKLHGISVKWGAASGATATHADSK